MLRDETREVGGAGRTGQGVQILFQDAKKPRGVLSKEVTQYYLLFKRSFCLIVWRLVALGQSGSWETSWEMGALWTRVGRCAGFQDIL